MNRSAATGQRLAAVFLLGCVLLNYPILFLLNRPLQVLGVPLLYAYIFCAWAALIALMGIIAERHREHRD